MRNKWFTLEVRIDGELCRFEDDNLFHLFYNVYKNYKGDRMFLSLTFNFPR